MHGLKIICQGLILGTFKYTLPLKFNKLLYIHVIIYIYLYTHTHLCLIYLLSLLSQQRERATVESQVRFSFMCARYCCNSLNFTLKPCIKQCLQDGCKSVCVYVYSQGEGEGEQNSTCSMYQVGQGKLCTKQCELFIKATI